MGQMTRDMWHMTHDIWHLTHDRGGGEVNLLSKYQLPSSYGLGGKVFWIFGGKDWHTQLINDVGVCRTAPATLGLLKKDTIWRLSSLKKGRTTQDRIFL